MGNCTGWRAVVVLPVAGQSIKASACKIYGILFLSTQYKFESCFKKCYWCKSRISANAAEYNNGIEGIAFVLLERLERVRLLDIAGTGDGR